MWWILGLLFAGFFGVIFYSAWLQQQKTVACQREYEDSLRRLEEDPNSVELRTAVVNAGRAYSEACRENGKVSMFDEVAMSNDLSARTGDAANSGDRNVRTCPDCAEQVRAAARKCRFCGCEFEIPQPV